MAFVEDLEAYVAEKLSSLDLLKEPTVGAVDRSEIVRRLKMALKNELEASEIAAIWMPTTPEVEVKLALARQVGDEAKHYRLIAEHLENMAVDLTAFNPGALMFGTLASDDPADELYHGSAPDSEPETRNIHWLLDQYRFTRWYLDIHSFTGDVLFPWGDDSDQTSNASMNFMNPAYNAQRGVDGGYQEFIPASDLTTVQGAAQRVTDAINGVRGGHYEAKQSVYLLGTTGAIRYPTSGTIDDYTYSRHFADCTRGKVFGLTVEFGYWTGDYRTSFHPPWTEMEQIVPEIDAGMVELCRIAAPAWVPPWKLLWRRLWPWQIWDPMIRLFEPLVRPLLVRVLGPRGAAG